MKLTPLHTMRSSLHHLQGVADNPLLSVDDQEDAHAVVARCALTVSVAPECVSGAPHLSPCAFEPPPPLHPVLLLHSCAPLAAASATSRYLKISKAAKQLLLLTTYDAAAVQARDKATCKSAAAAAADASASAAWRRAIVSSFCRAALADRSSCGSYARPSAECSSSAARTTLRRGQQGRKGRLQCFNRAVALIGLHLHGGRLLGYPQLHCRAAAAANRFAPTSRKIATGAAGRLPHICRNSILCVTDFVSAMESSTRLLLRCDLSRD